MNIFTTIFESRKRVWQSKRNLSNITHFCRIAKSFEREGEKEREKQVIVSEKQQTKTYLAYFDPLSKLLQEFVSNYRKTLNVLSEQPFHTTQTHISKHSILSDNKHSQLLFSSERGQRLLTYFQTQNLTSSHTKSPLSNFLTFCVCEKIRSGSERAGMTYIRWKSRPGFRVLLPHKRRNVEEKTIVIIYRQRKQSEIKRDSCLFYERKSGDYK